MKEHVLILPIGHYSCTLSCPKVCVCVCVCVCVSVPVVYSMPAGSIG